MAYQYAVRYWRQQMQILIYRINLYAKNRQFIIQFRQMQANGIEDSVVTDGPMTGNHMGDSHDMNDDNNFTRNHPLFSSDRNINNLPPTPAKIRKNKLANSRRGQLQQIKQQQSTQIDNGYKVAHSNLTPLPKRFTHNNQITTTTDTFQQPSSTPINSGNDYLSTYNNTFITKMQKQSTDLFHNESSGWNNNSSPFSAMGNSSSMLNEHVENGKANGIFLANKSRNYKLVNNLVKCISAYSQFQNYSKEEIRIQFYMTGQQPKIQYYQKGNQERIQGRKIYNFQKSNGCGNEQSGNQYGGNGNGNIQQVCHMGNQQNNQLDKYSGFLNIGAGQYQTNPQIQSFNHINQNSSLFPSTNNSNDPIFNPDPNCVGISSMNCIPNNHQPPTQLNNSNNQNQNTISFFSNNIQTNTFNTSTNTSNYVCLNMNNSVVPQNNNFVFAADRNGNYQLTSKHHLSTNNPTSSLFASGTQNAINNQSYDKSSVFGHSNSVNLFNTNYVNQNIVNSPINQNTVNSPINQNTSNLANLVPSPLTTQPQPFFASDNPTNQNMINNTPINTQAPNLFKDINISNPSLTQLHSNPSNQPNNQQSSRILPLSQTNIMHAPSFGSSQLFSNNSNISQPQLNPHLSNSNNHSPLFSPVTYPNASLFCNNSSINLNQHVTSSNHIVESNHHQNSQYNQSLHNSPQHSHHHSQPPSLQQITQCLFPSNAINATQPQQFSLNKVNNANNPRQLQQGQIPLNLNLNSSESSYSQSSSQQPPQNNIQIHPQPQLFHQSPQSHQYIQPHQSHHSHQPNLSNHSNHPNQYPQYHQPHQPYHLQSPQSHPPQSPQLHPQFINDQPSDGEQMNYHQLMQAFLLPHNLTLQALHTFKNEYVSIPFLKNCQTADQSISQLQKTQKTLYQHGFIQNVESVHPIHAVLYIYSIFGHILKLYNSYIDSIQPFRLLLRNIGFISRYFNSCKNKYDLQCLRHIERKVYKLKHIIPVSAVKIMIIQFFTSLVDITPKELLVHCQPIYHQIIERIRGIADHDQKMKLWRIEDKKDMKIDDFKEVEKQKERGRSQQSLEKQKKQKGNESYESYESYQRDEDYDRHEGYDGGEVIQQDFSKQNQNQLQNTSYIIQNQLPHLDPTFKMSPTLTQLKQMTRSQLKSVNDVKIQNSHGQIHFLQPLNLFKLDMRKCIKIQQNHIQLDHVFNCKRIRYTFNNFGNCRNRKEGEKLQLIGRMKNWVYGLKLKLISFNINSGVLIVES